MKIEDILKKFDGVATVEVREFTDETKTISSFLGKFTYASDGKMYDESGISCAIEKDIARYKLALEDNSTLALVCWVEQ